VTEPLTTRVLTVDPESPDPAALDWAAGVLLNDGLVAFATETVYGLGAVATNPAAVARIFVAKGRPAVNPVIVHVATIEQARQCVAIWPERAERLANHFWPGPLALVLPRAPVIPDVVTAGCPTVAVRAPAGRVALALIERVGKPIAAPSANRSNALSPTRAEHVLADLDGRIDAILDSGATMLGLESTVLDLSQEQPRVLRPGPISRATIEAVLGGTGIALERERNANIAPKSPGQMPVHYAPRTPAYRAGSLEEIEQVWDRDDIAVVVVGKPRAATQFARPSCVVLESPHAAAESLYAILHEYDARDYRAIVVVMPPDETAWEAVRDRLTRATRPLTEIG
jgi:L-threonylcarbamoyladenylate synthase